MPKLQGCATERRSYKCPLNIHIGDARRISYNTRKDIKKHIEQCN